MMESKSAISVATCRSMSCNGVIYIAIVNRSVLRRRAFREYVFTFVLYRLSMSSRDTLCHSGGLTNARSKAAHPPQHLAGLLELIESGVLSEARQTRDMTSAILAIGRWTRTPLDRLPAEPASLRRHLARLDHHEIGVGKGRFDNVKSLLNRALQLAGVKPANRPIAEVLTPAWRHLFDRLDDPYLRPAIAPFARFCAGAEIEPNCVSDEVAQRYLDHLESVSLTKKPRTIPTKPCVVCGTGPRQRSPDGRGSSWWCRSTPGDGLRVCRTSPRASRRRWTHTCVAWAVTTRATSWMRRLPFEH